MENSTTIYLIRFVEDSKAMLVPSVPATEGEFEYDGKTCTLLRQYELPIDLSLLQDDLRVYCPAVARSGRRTGPRVHKDHLGNEYPSLAKMCETYNIKESVYRSRVSKGWTVEEALTGSRKDSASSDIVDHLGNHYRSVSEMCRAYNVRPDNFCQRRKRGWTLEETLTGKRNTEVSDHLGNVYPDLNAMCAAYGVKRSTYNQRIRNGATVEQALSSQRHASGDRAGIPTEDHLGNKYPSQRSMCRHYGIKVAAFRARLRNGYSLEEALTAAHGHHRERTTATVTDPKGDTYSSVKKMCAAYGVNQGTYYSRLNKGMTMAQALATEPIRHQGRPSVEIADHEGTVFPSVKAMCDHYGVNYCTYRQRLSNGATLEQALTTAHGRKGMTVDHLGNQYNTVRDMCDHYGVNYCTYRNRLRSGMSLEEALTSGNPEDSSPENTMTPVLSGPCTDHLGNQYSDPGEMAKAYGLTKDQYLARARFGWDVKSILTTPVRASGRRKLVVYNGKEYSSRKALCSELGINYNTFIIRLGNGMSLEDAVAAGLSTTPPIKHRTTVYDHLGTAYPSVSRMCQAYNISPTVYMYRMSHGKTLEEALTEPVRPRSKRSDDTSLEGEVTLEESPAPEETPAEEA